VSKAGATGLEPALYPRDRGEVATARRGSLRRTSVWCPARGRASGDAFGAAQTASTSGCTASTTSGGSFGIGRASAGKRPGDSPPTQKIAKRCASSGSRWPSSLAPRPIVVRGEIFRLPPRRGARGHEPRGARFAVIVQADEFLDLNTTLVAPTSRSARPASFRPAIVIDRRATRVLLEQMAVVDPQRLGRSAGRLEADEGERGRRSSQPDPRTLTRARWPELCHLGAAV
jgi:mRNA interferase MazF